MEPEFSLKFAESYQLHDMCLCNLHKLQLHAVDHTMRPMKFLSLAENFTRTETCYFLVVHLLVPLKGVDTTVRMWHSKELAGSGNKATSNME